MHFLPTHFESHTFQRTFSAYTIKKQQCPDTLRECSFGKAVSFMKHRLARIFPFLLFPVIALGVGWLSSLLTRYGLENIYPTLQKSSLTPPDIVFPIVWTILYVLMGIGMALVWNKGCPSRTTCLALWIFQLFFNFFWSILFFGWNLHLIALIWLIALIVLVVLMALCFHRCSPTAAWMQLPYLLWLLFAGYLNWAVWVLNH